MNKTRLDRFLTQQHPQYSRTQVKKLIDEGFVLIDGEKRRPSFLLHGGEKIEMARRAPEIPRAEPEAIPLNILYEDDDLLVINKEAGMVVHPAPGNYRGTLVNAILYHLFLRDCREMFQMQGAREGPTEAYLSGTPQGGAERAITAYGGTPPTAVAPQMGFYRQSLRPGIVHRLDKGTSGVIVVAKNELVQRNLSSQFKDRKVKKIYHALVFGTFAQKEGTISQAIGRDSVHRRKFSSKTRRGREAVTRYKVQKEYPGLALLELRPETGRTHQIRVHLSEAGHPIAGDTLYGAKAYLSSIADLLVRQRLGCLTRPLLHALELRLTHPRTGDEIGFVAPLPNDFRSVLEGIQ